MATQPDKLNDVLRDESIAHALQIERLKNAEQKVVVAFIEDELLPDLIAKLETRISRIQERGFDTGPVTTDRIKRLISTLQDSVDKWTSRVSEIVLQRLEEIGPLEAQFAASQLNDALTTVPVKVDLAIPSAAKLLDLSLNRPVDGVLITKLLENFSANTKNQVERALRLGLASGETLPQIVSRVRRVTDLARGASEALVRTAIQTASTTARDQIFRANENLIQGVQWVATLDTRTCPTCGPLDGRVFAIGKGPRPPLHVQCRCSTVPVLKSWRQLGIKASELDATTRASIDGQVSGNLTFGQWLERRSAADQEDVLGATRAKLFRQGNLPITDFVNNKNELITLDALRRKYAAAFARAGV